MLICCEVIYRNTQHCFFSFHLIPLVWFVLVLSFTRLWRLCCFCFRSLVFCLWYLKNLLFLLWYFGNVYGWCPLSYLILKEESLRNKEWCQVSLLNKLGDVSLVYWCLLFELGTIAVSLWDTPTLILDKWSKRSKSSKRAILI